jgi:hypothetical protein
MSRPQRVSTNYDDDDTTYSQPFFEDSSSFRLSFPSILPACARPMY